VLVAEARARVWEFGKTVRDSGCFLNSKLLLGFFRFCGCLKEVMEMDCYVLQYRNYENDKAPTKAF
jgi:hypothetical protein